MTYLRQPSPLEFSYIATDEPHASPLVNQLTIVGEGDIDTARLQSALDQAIAANPGLGVRLRGMWGWRVWDSNGARPRVQEVHAPDWQGNTSEDAPCYGAPVNLRKDPVCQLIKIRTTDKLYLLFRLHHAVTDGRGTIHLMNDVFRILRGEAPIGSTSTKTEWDIAMSQERPPRPVVEGDCLPIIKGTLRADVRGYHWYRFDWKGNKNKLAAKLLFAAGVLARKHHGEGKVLFRVPADLRRYMAPEEGISVANCSGAIDMEIPTDADVNSIRSQLVRAMRNKEDISPFAENMKIARWLPRSVFLPKPQQLQQTHASQRYRMSGIVSFMGDVNMDMFACEGFTPVSQFGVPIPFENRPLIITGGTYGDVTNLVVACPRAVATMDELKAFAGELAQTLDGL